MIIGITGYAGSGKDTVANILVKEYGFVKVALADPIKRICRDVFDFSDEQLWGVSGERNKEDPRYPRPGYSHLTPRHALQQLGSEWGRACYENVWVDYALRVAAQLTAQDSNGLGFAYDPVRGLSPRMKVQYRGVVISDVRFPNEVAAIRAKGGRIWRTVHGHGLEGAAALHQSEQHIDNLDVQFRFPVCGLDVLPTAVKAALMPEHWQPAWHAPASGSPAEIACEFHYCINPAHFGGRL